MVYERMEHEMHIRQCTSHHNPCTSHHHHYHHFDACWMCCHFELKILWSTLSVSQRFNALWQTYAKLMINAKIRYDDKNNICWHQKFPYSSSSSLPFPVSQNFFPYNIRFLSIAFYPYEAPKIFYFTIFYFTSKSYALFSIP